MFLYPFWYILNSRKIYIGFLHIFSNSTIEKCGFWSELQKSTFFGTTTKATITNAYIHKLYATAKIGDSFTAQKGSFTGFIPTVFAPIRIFPRYKKKLYRPTILTILGRKRNLLRFCTDSWHTIFSPPAGIGH